MKINHKELQSAGFRKTGNWWIKDNVSVNLISNTILHGHQPSFYVENVNAEITLQDIEDFSRIMAKLLGGS